MMPNCRMTVLGLMLVLPVTTQAGEPPGGRPQVAIEMEVEENTLDGCTGCGCRATVELGAGGEHEWWASFGLVRSDVQKGWEAAASSSHCGRGSYDRAALDFKRTIGTAYVIMNLSATFAVLPAGNVSLTMVSRLLTFSGFDKNGKPTYARSTQNRVISFAGQGGLTLPLLLPDQREKESFGVHEVLIQLRASLLGMGPAASYGTISVSADEPGAEILLDGGFVDRIAEGSPTLLRHVLVGTREIRVRDFSGREARRQVVVGKDATVEVGVSILGPRPTGPRDNLVPIGRNPQGSEEYWRTRDGAIVVRVPAGEFLMGSPEGQGEPDERPQRRVYLPEFLIDKTEVTWRQLRKFVEAEGATLPPAPLWGTPDDYPASSILWDEAEAFCAWVGGRLPTEAQWEKAARGTDGRTYPWGAEWDSALCNSLDGGPHRPESAGSYPDCVSPYGALDIAGGVWEWCADWYGELYGAGDSPRNPMGPASGSLRVLRGGSWINPSSWLRASFRHKGDPTWRNVLNGFRCVQDAPE